MSQPDAKNASLEKLLAEKIIKDKPSSLDAVLARAYLELEKENSLLIQTLEKISNEDYRGNRPQASVDAFNVLKRLKK